MSRAYREGHDRIFGGGGRQQGKRELRWVEVALAVAQVRLQGGEVDRIELRSILETFGREVATVHGVKIVENPAVPPGVVYVLPPKR